MKILNTRYYADEIFDFDYGPDAVVNELSEDEIGAEDTYHKYRLAEIQSGKEIVVTYVNETDERRFKFKITDEVRQSCKYTGDNPDEVPTSVFHTVHENGYSVDNVETLGDWYNIWLDVKLARIALYDLVDDPHDPIHADLNPYIWRSLHTLEELAGIRYLISDTDEYASFIDNNDRIQFEEPINESDTLEDGSQPIRDIGIYPHVGLLIDHLPEEYRTSLQKEVFNPEHIEVSNLAIKSVFPPDDDVAFVDLFTPWGVQRFRFQTQGTCHYIKSQGAQSERPNSYVIDVIQSHGYNVENADSVFEAVDTGSVVRTCLDMFQQLMQIAQWRDTPKEVFDIENHMAGSNMIVLIRLLVAVETAEIAPNIYQEGRDQYARTYHQNPNRGATVLMDIVQQMSRDQKKELGSQLAKCDFINESVVKPNRRTHLQLANNIGDLL